MTKTWTPHGHSPSGKRSKTYKAWHAMKQRCLNPKNQFFHHYGGRGITLCDRWHGFAAFLEDMGVAPHGLSLDRIDNDRGYEPGNCRWTAQKDQMRNRRTNVFIEFQGERLTVQDWSRRTGIAFTTLRTRMKAGWPVERVLSTQRFATNQFTTTEI